MEGKKPMLGKLVKFSMVFSHGKIDAMGKALQFYHLLGR